MLKLKVKVLETGRPSYRTAQELEIEESRWSRIVSGRITPNDEERARIVAKFGADALRPLARRQHQESGADTNG